MRFKKPFRAVPINPDPAYLERRKKWRDSVPVKSRRSIEVEEPDRSTSPTNYRFKPSSRGWGTGRVILVGVTIGAIIGFTSIALKKDGLARLRDVAVAAGIVRVRAPQSGDYWPGCEAAREAGTSPIYASEPGYRPEMDGDSDGIACEPYRGN